MATFTVDLISGNIYLFSGDFSSSGSTPVTGSTSYPQVNSYTNLPAAGTVTGKIYVVRNGTNPFGALVDYKPSGFYFSTGAAWKFLGDTPDFFKSSNFQVYDSVDDTKGVMFVTSGITTGNFRTLKVQNSSGTIAYLTDLNTKVDTTVFNTYVNTTAPATYYTKTQINSYTGQTATAISGKQNTLTAGSGISIVGSVISTTDTLDLPLQLKDISGNTEINTITQTPIVWTTKEYDSPFYNYTGGSRIYIVSGGTHYVSYALNFINQTSQPKNIAAMIRKNGNTDIELTTGTAFSINSVNNAGSIVLPHYEITLSAGDYVELTAFRIGDTGSVLTKVNGSWIRLEKV